MEVAGTSLFWDFISFRVLMTPAILVIVYYVGAIAGPLILIWFFRKTSQASRDMAATPRKGRLRESVITDNSSILIISAITLIIVMEIGWRMLFEILIAYFQIHNALMQTAG